MNYLTTHLSRIAPVLIILAITVVVVWAVNWFLRRRERENAQREPVGRQLIVLVLGVVGLVALILALPVDASTREQLLTALGLLVTVAVAFSSTTFVSNAIAGLMLRTVDNFRPGDFVEVKEQFGRVTERGLFHVEIQTEDRNLSTLPNMFLVSNPVTVVTESGTIVSATVSLGYDIPHTRVEALLKEAASETGLENPFVYILDLGDFSITYRFAGFLPEIKQLLSIRSRLRANALDVLHEAGIEIVSPTFMNQRQIAESPHVIPPPPEAGEAAAESEVEANAEAEAESETQPEAIMFDKAEKAGEIEELREERATLLQEIEELEEQEKQAEGETSERIEAELAEKRARVDEIDKQLEPAEDEEAG